jgi:hypothetical protein
MNINIAPPPASLEIFHSRIDKIITKHMKHDERGKKDAVKKAGGMPTKTQLHKAVLATKRSKYSKDCMLRETKQKMSKEYQRELRKNLSEDPVKKEEFDRKKSEYMAHIRACEKWATSHNKRHGSMLTRSLPRYLRRKPHSHLERCPGTTYLSSPKMMTLGQDIYYERELLAKWEKVFFRRSLPHWCRM